MRYANYNKYGDTHSTLAVRTVIAHAHTTRRNAAFPRQSVIGSERFGQHNIINKQKKKIFNGMFGLFQMLIFV